MDRRLAVHVMVVSAFALAWAEQAPAQEIDRVPYVDRPMTLPARTGALDARFDVRRVQAVPPYEFTYAGAFGGAYGVTDDMTLSMTPVSVESSAGRASYGRFGAEATVRFFSTDVVEVGAGLRFQLDPEVAQADVQPKVRVAIHAGHRVRIDTGATLTLGVGRYARFDLWEIKVASSEPGIPLVTTVQIVPALFAALRTGFTMYQLGSSNGNDVVVPLGAAVGVTIPHGGKPAADVVGSFDFPEFAWSRAATVGIVNRWQLGVSARMFLPM